MNPGQRPGWQRYQVIRVRTAARRGKRKTPTVGQTLMGLRTGPAAGPDEHCPLVLHISCLRIQSTLPTRCNVTGDPRNPRKRVPRCHVKFPVPVVSRRNEWYTQNPQEIVAKRYRESARYTLQHTNIKKNPHPLPNPGPIESAAGNLFATKTRKSKTSPRKTFPPY